MDKATIKQCALDAGFDLVGVASADAFGRERKIVLERLGKWMMGGMAWYTEARVLRGTDPQAILPGARSIISMAVNYLGDLSSPALGEGQGEGSPFPQGRVARYAQGRYYHLVLRKQLN